MSKKVVRGNPSGLGPKVTVEKGATKGFDEICAVLNDGPYKQMPAEVPPSDNWDKNWRNFLKCEFCMFYTNYRCRRNAPRGQDGWSAVYPTDWCGQHKMDKSTMANRP